MARAGTKNKNTVKINSGIITITFEDDNLDDPVFSKFRINPADLNTAERAIESSEYFENLEWRAETIADAARTQKEIEEKISYILGYDSTNDIFGVVPALTVFPDGSIFVEHVVDKIMEAVEPAIAQRQENMQKRAEKYTGKYDKK